MLKTLHWFLTRELAKVTVLSLVAFTLVMTVFAIIEPLRKQGLATEQVLNLIGYTLPMMVSLTLPVAAVFGATVVYGRFSQDNELLACRAGGIATLTLLKPALMLGVLVTAVSLWLNNWVTPMMAERAEKTIRNNIRSIAYYQLRRQGYVRQGGYTVHVDSVNEVDDEVRGVVLTYVKNPKDLMGLGAKDANFRSLAYADANLRSPFDITLITADRAKLEFREIDGEWYVGIHMEHPVATRTSMYNIVSEDEAPIQAMPLGASARDDPYWYTWGRLVETMRRPATNMSIERALKGLCTDFGHELFVDEVVKTIEAGKPYIKLEGPAGKVALSAPRAERRPLEALLLSKVDAGGRRVPVVVRVAGPREVRVTEADRCRVTVARSQWKGVSLVSLELEGDVRVRSEDASAPSGEAAGPGDWMDRETAQLGDLNLPPDMTARMGRIDPNEVLDTIALSSDQAVLRARDQVFYKIQRLRGQILAEMHGRLAYGVSCFLMVAMGAALGLMFRGGQLLSAFVLSMMPATVVIIMILMGKQMLTSRLPPSYGIAAIWCGIVLLSLGDLVLYARLARK